MKRAAFIGLMAGLWFVGGELQAEKGAPPPKGSQEKTVLETISGEFQRHNYKKVIQLYRDYVDGKPGHLLPTIVKILYSQSLADTGEIDDAINSLREILVDLPPEADRLKLQYDLANLLFLQKRYDEARSAYQKILLQSSQVGEILLKARERIGNMKDKDSGARKKDFVTLQLMDLETNLDGGTVPDGTEAFLQQVAEQTPTSVQAEQAKKLQARVKELKADKAKTLLEEARRLFDQEKKYAEVREILDQIAQYYSDVGDMTSVEALSKEVNARLGKTR